MGKPVLVAAAVLLTANRRLLMCYRADGQGWEVPGGKVEDETVAEGCRRELLEETGIEANDPAPPLLGIAEPDPALLWGVRYCIHFLLIRSWKGEPRVGEPDKCRAWWWFPVSALPPVRGCSPGSGIFIETILPDFLKRVDGHVEGD